MGGDRSQALLAPCVLTEPPPIGAYLYDKLKHKEMQYIGQSLISVDWLSIYVSTVAKRQPKHGSVRVMEYGTQVYQFTEYYQRDGKDVAILTYAPRSSALVKDTGIIKVLNEFLYTRNIYELVMSICEDWGLTPLSVSRLDICADFNRFVAYEDMNAFFEDFLSCRIWHIGKCKYKVIGKEARRLQDDTFAVQGVQSSRHSFQYLRFGGNTSDVSAYLYNKSLEFKEVKQKNYISEMWAKNGLDEQSDVWRLEFSLKGNAIKILDDVTGEAFFDKLLIVKEPLLIRRLFAALYNRYWDFRVNDGQVRKDRMKRCNLLKINDIPFKLEKFVMCPNATIGDKRLLSSMERVYSEIRHASEEDAAIIHWASSLIAKHKKLTIYAQRKGFGVKDI